MPTRWDVERAVTGSHIGPNARLIVLALLTKVDNDTATTLPEYTPAFSTLAAMTGLSKAVLSEWLQALEDGGWVERTKAAGRGNRTIYSLRPGADEIERRSRALRTPRRPVNSSPSEPFTTAEKVRPANALELKGSPSERFSEEKGFAQRTPKGSPSEPFSAVKGSPSERASTNPSPTGKGVLKNPPSAIAVADAAPAEVQASEPEEITSSAPVNAPVVPGPRWADSDRKPTTPVAVRSETAALFPKPKQAAVETWPEIHQVIHRWLQANGYRGFGLDEVRDIHRQLIAAHPGKAPQYLTSVIGNGGCAAYAEPIKKARHEKIEALVNDVRAAHPQCSHGMPAGDQPHPTTGTLLCAHCRRGMPAQAAEDATNPDVQAAITAYRSRRGNDIYFAELLSITQQIEAFLAEGATPTQVAALAVVAGEQRISLIQAAGVAA